VRYEMRHDYLYAEVSGLFSLAEAFRTFTETMEWIGGKDVRRILVDARALKGSPSTVDLYEYGTFVASEIARFSAAGKIGHVRLAYVTLGSMLDKDRLAQTAASNRGAVVMTTDSMEDALRWLSVGSAT